MFHVTLLDRSCELYKEVKALDRQVLRLRQRALSRQDEKLLRRANGIIRQAAVARAELHSIQSRIF